MISPNKSREFLDKLTILYIYKLIGSPVKMLQVSTLVLKEQIMNYFTLLSLTEELYMSEMLNRYKADNEFVYYITDKGITSLCAFDDKIYDKDRKKIKEAVLNLKEEIQQNNTIHAEYMKISEDNYSVNLKIVDSEITIIDLTLNVASNKTAKMMCNRWKDNTIEIFMNIMKALEN